jgi:hypothetical protein
MSTFKGISSIGQTTLSNVLQTNVISYFDWGFVNAGGFVNVTTATSSGLYGGDYSVLRPVQDPSYTNGRVWEAKRGNWVWENGTEVNTPISISGVYINNVLTTSGFHYDYPNGRVIFNTPLSTSSGVKVNYSYKSVKVVDAEEVPFLQRLQYESFRVDDSNFIVGSGNNIGLAHQRVQMPAVGVSHIGRQYKGYQIGDKSVWSSDEMLFDVFAEDKDTAQKIADIISYQTEVTTFLFDPSLMPASSYPLDYRGSVVNPSSVYPNIIRSSGDGGYRYQQAQFGKVTFENPRIQEGTWLNHDVYHIPVRLGTKLVFSM